MWRPVKDAFKEVPVKHGEDAKMDSQKGEKLIYIYIDVEALTRTSPVERKRERESEVRAHNKLVVQTAPVEN